MVRNLLTILGVLAGLTTVAAAADEPVFRNATVSNAFDFTIAILDIDENGTGYSDEALCRTIIGIYPKGESASAMQQIELEMPFPLNESKRPYYSEDSLVCPDINFDGHDDLVFLSGHMGSYGGPSFDIYLYEPDKKAFIRNEALEELGYMGLGLFKIDPERKILGVSSKSGCCYHQYDEFVMENNLPVLVYTKSETLVWGGYFDENGGYHDEENLLEISESRLVNGKWQTSEKQETLLIDD